MPRQCFLVVAAVIMLALAVAATPVVAAEPFAPPTPEALSALKQLHNKHAPWRVALDSTQFQVRAHKVDAFGISGLKPLVKGTSVPKAIAWSEIARIDERKSNRRSGQLSGAILGAVAAPTIAVLAGFGDPIPMISLFAGAWFGSRVGSVRGDRQVQWVPVHVSPTLVEAAPAIAAAIASDSTTDSLRTAAAPDSARGNIVEVPSAAAGAGSAEALAPVEPSRDVLEACQRIQPTSLLRVHADFGLFEGNVAHAGPEGLSGLRVAPDAAATITAAPDMVSWTRIGRVELHGNLAASGAIGGAIGLGAVGAIIGLTAVVAMGAAGTGPSDSGTAWILGGAAIGAASGAVLGAAAGSIRYKWRRIFPR